MEEVKRVTPDIIAAQLRSLADRMEGDGLRQQDFMTAFADICKTASQFAGEAEASDPADLSAKLLDRTADLMTAVANNASDVDDTAAAVAECVAGYFIAQYKAFKPANTKAPEGTPMTDQLKTLKAEVARLKKEAEKQKEQALQRQKEKEEIEALRKQSIAEQEKLYTELCDTVDSILKEFEAGNSAVEDSELLRQLEERRSALVQLYSSGVALNLLEKLRRIIEMLEDLASSKEKKELVSIASSKKIVDGLKGRCTELLETAKSHESILTEYNIMFSKIDELEAEYKNLISDEEQRSINDYRDTIDRAIEAYERIVGRFIKHLSHDYKAIWDKIKN